jgi:hypothetical protein
MITSWYIGRLFRTFGELFRNLQHKFLARNTAARNLTNAETSNVTRPLFIRIFIAELIFAFLPVISYYVDRKLWAAYGCIQAGEGFWWCYWFSNYLCIGVNWLCLIISKEVSTCWSRNYSLFMDSEYSLPRRVKLDTRSCPKQFKPVHLLTSHFNNYPHI